METSGGQDANAFVKTFGKIEKYVMTSRGEIEHKIMLKNLYQIMKHQPPAKGKFQCGKFSNR